MSFSEDLNSTNRMIISFRFSYLMLIFISVLILLATFLVSSSTLSIELRTTIFGALVLLYLIFCGGFYLLQNRRQNFAPPDGELLKTQKENIFTPEIEEKLFILEEAKLFLSASLKTGDVFRLVSNRVADLIPFATCALFLADENKTKLKVIQAVGENAADFLKVETTCFEGLAGKTFLSRQIELDEKLLLEKKAIELSALNGLEKAIAVPLKNNELEVFAVLTLYGNIEQAFNDAQTSQLLKAIAQRISPLFWNSLIFERNTESALTDSLTNLPNERAFYLVLENQIAESQRFREERPLTVLCVDIKDFDKLNKNYGHAGGDQILKTAAKIIKEQLRQMDFLSRSAGDEFLAVLPTASEEITKVIIERIEKAFTLNRFEFDGREEVHIELNFGAATFIKDGETAQELLKRTRLKKQEAKSALKSSVLWFPREYVN